MEGCPEPNLDIEQDVFYFALAGLIAFGARGPVLA